MLEVVVLQQLQLTNFTDFKGCLRNSTHILYIKICHIICLFSFAQNTVQRARRLYSKGEHIQVSQHQVVTLSLAVSKTLAVNCLLIVKLVKVGARLNTKHHQLTITKIYQSLMIGLSWASLLTPILRAMKNLTYVEGLKILFFLCPLSALLGILINKY